MEYRPSQYPVQLFSFITFVIVMGLLLGYTLDKRFIVISLFIWAAITFLFSLLQVVHKSTHSYLSITETLLHPSWRFLLFESLAAIGILGVMYFDNMGLGAAMLGVWWLFSFNFYMYYI